MGLYYDITPFFINIKIFFYNIFVFIKYFLYICQKYYFKMSLQGIKIDGEPSEVTEIREKILNEFKDLTFVEDGHKYFINGKQLPSVSEVTHRFCAHPFNDVEQAEKYAETHGETPQYWLDKWRFTSLKATTSGTLVHEYGESLGWLRNGHSELITESCKPKYVKDKNWLIPTRGKEEGVLKFYDELNENLHFVLAETKVYSNKSEESNVSNQFCGTFDLLMWYNNPKDSSKSGLIVLDWKTNRELTKDFSREHDKFLLPPFADLYEEPLSYYTLQLNLYSLCLHGIGLNPIGARVIWLKDDGTYELVPIKLLYKEDWFKQAF